MIYQGDDKARLRRQVTREAIALAMQSRWQEAVAVNQRLVESFPTDVDAYNRLGRALTELGEFSQARECYSRALELDTHNLIAQKNLARLSLLSEEHQAQESEPGKLAPQLFLEEQGSTGIASLGNLASPEVLAKLVAGDQVYLRAEGQRLVVVGHQGTYLGEVERRHSSRLLKLMEGGNKYSAAIASLGQEGVKVVIKEIYRHPDQSGLLSFPLKSRESFRPYIRSTLLKYELEDEESPLGSEEEGGYAPEAEEAAAQAEDIVIVEEEVLSQGEEEPE